MTTPAVETTPEVAPAPKNKGGRPRSDNTRIFAIRITDDDLKNLIEQEKATGLTKTELVRNAIKGVKSVTRISKTDEQMLGQIRLVGTNLNQSTMALNALSRAKLIDAETLTRYQVQLENVKTLLTDFKNNVLKEAST